jgi:hypothetical protein
MSCVGRRVVWSVNSEDPNVPLYRPTRLLRYARRTDLGAACACQHHQVALRRSTNKKDTLNWRSFTRVIQKY